MTGTIKPFDYFLSNTKWSWLPKCQITDVKILNLFLVADYPRKIIWQHWKKIPVLLDVVCFSQKLLFYNALVTSWDSCHDLICIIPFHCSCPRLTQSSVTHKQVVLCYKLFNPLIG